MNSLHRRIPKTRIFIISLVVAGLVVAGFVPTPNIIGGGDVKMFLIIFLTVGLKATIEYLWGRRFRDK